MYAEIENLRAAWRWAVQTEELDRIYQATPALVLYYWMRARNYQEADHLAHILEALKRVQEKFPEDPRLSGVIGLFLVTLSIFYRDMERYEDSRLALQEGLALTIHLPVDQVVSLTLALANFGVDFYEKDQVEELYLRSLEMARLQEDRWREALIILQRSEALLMEGNFKRSYELQLQAIEIVRSLGDRWGTANGYRNLADRAMWMGEYVEARWLGEECLAIYEEVDDRWSILSVNLFLGQVETALGAYQEAKEHYHTCLDLLSETGNRYMTCITLDSLGYLEYLLGEYSQAEAHHLRSLELYCQINDRRGYGMALNNLGDVLRARHELAAARKRYQEALRVAQEVTDLWGLTKSLKNLGRLCADEGDVEKAAMYYQWALITGLESGRVSEYTEVLMGIAESRQEMGETAQAIEILALVANHPGTMQLTRQQATQKLEELEGHMEPEIFAQAVIRGKSKTAADWVEG
jgi:tetratricopeptide (TPR) repeat protein